MDKQKPDIYLKLTTVFMLISMCVGGALYVNAGDAEVKKETRKETTELKKAVVSEIKDIHKKVNKQQVDIAVIKQILINKHGLPEK